jgi:hypothetical protein
MKLKERAFKGAILFLHNLPLANERGLLLPEINLIVQTVRLVDDGFDYGVYDFTAMHIKSRAERRLPAKSQATRDC